MRLALATGLGWLVANMLVGMLTHVFDPPPDTLAVPWGFLAGLGGAAALAGVAASGVTALTLRRLQLGRLLREH